MRCALRPRRRTSPAAVLQVFAGPRAKGHVGAGMGEGECDARGPRPRLPPVTRATRPSRRRLGISNSSSRGRRLSMVMVEAKATAGPIARSIRGPQGRRTPSDADSERQAANVVYPKILRAFVSSIFSSTSAGRPSARKSARFLAMLVTPGAGQSLP